MADAVWAKATTLAVRWLCAAAMAVSMYARTLTVALRRYGSTWSTSAGRRPPVGQQLLDPTVQVRGQPRENYLQVGARVVPAELGRVKQARHHSGDRGVQHRALP